jgi:hypothetical protein
LSDEFDVPVLSGEVGAYGEWAVPPVPAPLSEDRPDPDADAFDEKATTPPKPTTAINATGTIARCLKSRARRPVI